MLLAVAVAAAVTGACSASDGDGAAGGGASEARPLPAEEAPRASQDAQGAVGAMSAAHLPELGPAVIKTATVKVSVDGDEVQQAVDEATGVAGRLGGFVASTTLTGGDHASGTVVIRVPSDAFEEALGALRDLGDVEHETVSGEDVSQEFIDLQARLRNWQAQEAVLLRLMERSRTVTDTIRVQGELSRVQLEIERLRGRLTYLEDQTSLGTITATFVAPGGAPPRPTTLARAWEEAVDAMLTVVSAVIVGAGFLLPLAVLAGAVALAIRSLRPRLSP